MTDNKRPETSYIAVHCSATRPSMNVDASVIRRWHVEQNGWADIGYHYVILRNGVIQAGRHMDVIGAHVEGFNSRALGICLAGGINDAGNAEDNFMPVQKEVLLELLRVCKRYAPNAVIRGHRDFPAVKKDCPSFDVRSWLKVVAPELL